MVRYANKSGESGVSAYEIGLDSIKVWFVNRSRPYLYNYLRPGKRKVERMKKLALKGEGLSTYISQYIKNDYWEE